MPEHHGSPADEYIALRDGAGLVDPGWQAVRVHGADAVSFLQGLLSQDLQPGTCARTFLLGPRGKLRALAWAIVAEDEVLLVSESADVLVEDLSRYRIRVQAEIEHDERRVHLLVGALADDALPTAPPDGGWVAGDAWTVGDVSVHGRRRRLLVGDVPLGDVTPVGDLAAAALRIELGEPRMDIDVDESTIPQETGLVEASVSFTKGCYLGQELVARIDSRGRVNQRLVGIRLSDAVIPPLGADVLFDGDAVGRLTSIAESLDLRAPVGLAVIRREAEDGAAVTVSWDGGTAAAVVAGLPLH